MIALVVAASANNAIGKNNQLLWHLPNDLKFFKNITWGFPIIMGRKTFEAVNRPLPGRTNIIVTRQPGWEARGVTSSLNVEDAIQKGLQTNGRQIFIIGGGEIYKQAIPLADTIYLTRVHVELEGDTFFPELDESRWKLVANDDFPADEKHAYAYSFQVWKKI